MRLGSFSEHPGLNNMTASFLKSQSFPYKIVKTKNFFLFAEILVVVYIIH